MKTFPSKQNRASACGDGRRRRHLPPAAQSLTGLSPHLAVL
jgi:hypothetical protein